VICVSPGKHMECMRQSKMASEGQHKVMVSRHTIALVFMCTNCGSVVSL